MIMPMDTKPVLDVLRELLVVFHNYEISAGNVRRENRDLIMDLYRNNKPSGNLVIDTLLDEDMAIPLGLDFAYRTEAQPQFSISSTGMPFSMLNRHYSHPSALRVEYDKAHWPDLSQFTDPRIPPKYVSTELFPRGKTLEIRHSFDPLVPKDHVCIAVDPQYASFFPDAKYQPEQGHYCIHGPELVPIIPAGSERFDEIILSIGFPPRLEDEPTSFGRPTPFGRYVSYIEGLPLPDNKWIVTYDSLFGMRFIKNDEGRIEASICAYVPEIAYPEIYKSMVEDAIRAVNTLTAQAA